MTASSIAQRLDDLLRAEETDLISAYLFGTEAEGRAHGESDVDLAVLVPLDRFPDSAARFEYRLSLSSRLAGGLGGRALDPVVLVIDIAGELSARRGDRFEDYMQAVRTLVGDRRFPDRWYAAWSGFRASAMSSCTSTSP